MAINVDTVYKTVLLILNKEQRGYMTPDEFNKTAAQVQLEIFESYFDDLNQQLRLPDNDSEYADRQKSLQEKLSVFHSVGNCVYNAPCFDVPVDPAGFYKLGTVIYNDEKEVQYVYPTSIVNNITATYLRKPLDPIWDFTATPPYYQYVYNSGTSVDFELHPTVQVNVITRILLYSGVIIKDPQIIQVAAQQIQAENINSKS